MTDSTEKSGTKPSSAQVARRLVRQALKGALATLDRSSGTPYASLVTVATGHDGSPLLLLSQLALHTQNLAADPRVSLLIDASSPVGDPLAGGRVTVMGRIERTDSPDARRRFLARHPAAQMYASFPDFAFYVVIAESAHFIGGFGRIVDIPARDLLTPVSSASAVIEAEDDIIAHMNADHADAVALYAAQELGRPAEVGEFLVCGVDPEGFDLLGRDTAVRIGFPTRVETPGDARRAFKILADKARASG